MRSLLISLVVSCVISFHSSDGSECNLDKNERIKLACLTKENEWQVSTLELKFLKETGKSAHETDTLVKSCIGGSLKKIRERITEPDANRFKRDVICNNFCLDVVLLDVEPHKNDDINYFTFHTKGLYNTSEEIKDDLDFEKLNKCLAKNFDVEVVDLYPGWPRLHQNDVSWIIIIVVIIFLLLIIFILLVVVVLKKDKILSILQKRNSLEGAYSDANKNNEPRVNEGDIVPL